MVGGMHKRCDISAITAGWFVMLSSLTHHKSRKCGFQHSSRLIQQRRPSLCCAGVCCALQARPATEVLQRVRGVLRHVTAANLPDLLSITLSYCPIETARDGASILLDHDRDHLHLLHTDKAQGVTAAAAAPAQPLINSAEDDSTTQELSVDGIAYVQRTTSHLAVAPIAQVMRPALLLATWRLCTGW